MRLLSLSELIFLITLNLRYEWKYSDISKYWWYNNSKATIWSNLQPLCFPSKKSKKYIKTKFTRLKIKEIDFFIQLSGNIILVKPFYLNLKT